MSIKIYGNIATDPDEDLERICQLAGFNSQQKKYTEVDLLQEGTGLPPPALNEEYDKIVKEAIYSNILTNIFNDSYIKQAAISERIDTLVNDIATHYANVEVVQEMINAVPEVKKDWLKPPAPPAPPIGPAHQVSYDDICFDESPFLRGIIEFFKKNIAKIKIIW